MTKYHIHHSEYFNRFQEAESSYQAAMDYAKWFNKQEGCNLSNIGSQEIEVTDDCDMTRKYLINSEVIFNVEEQ